jgi:hypothetical protein
VQGTSAARKPRTTASAASRAAKPRTSARGAATRSKPRSSAAARRPARAARGPVASGGVIALPVVAVGRTAHAVSGLADSGLVSGLARSRAWIVLLGLLLAGIVAINVMGLSLGAANSGIAAKIDALERDNAVQRTRIAERTSTDRIQHKAAALALQIPAPDDVHYLHAGKGDAAEAAKRLAAGEIADTLPADEAAMPEAVDPAAGTTTDATVDPAATTTVDPATTTAVDPVSGAAIDPTTGAPVTTATTDPAATATTVP